MFLPLIPDQEFDMADVAASKTVAVQMIKVLDPADLGAYSRGVLEVSWVDGEFTSGDKFTVALQPVHVDESGKARIGSAPLASITVDNPEDIVRVAFPLTGPMTLFLAAERGVIVTSQKLEAKITASLFLMRA